MRRLIEPELMDCVDQVAAYNTGSKHLGIEAFINFYENHINLTKGKIVDLGCGTGDYLVALAKKYPDLTIVGYDGSPNMIQQAEQNVKGFDISVICKQFGDIVESADCVISVNTLHHLHDPAIFWKAVESISTNVLVMDIIRPKSAKLAKSIVDTIIGSDSEIFKTDFYNSLLAAFSTDELVEQIKNTGYSIKFQGDTDFSRLAFIYNTTGN
jgi:cyclopropane fatty-acyl-phospholipid synthase-like methyltransferase